MLEVVSSCCKADVRNVDPRITCSTLCHELYVLLLERQFGSFKKCTDTSTGVTHKVPTRYIIEHGLRQDDLKGFPVWQD